MLVDVRVVKPSLLLVERSDIIPIRFGDLVNRKLGVGRPFSAVKVVAFAPVEVRHCFSTLHQLAFSRARRFRHACALLFRLGVAHPLVGTGAVPEHALHAIFDVLCVSLHAKRTPLLARQQLERVAAALAAGEEAP